jgi:hypothetical protein
LEKCTAEKFFFGSKTTIYLSTSKHEICKFFLLLWVIFALLDLDPNSEYEYGSGSIDLIESGSNRDPDPKHCSGIKKMIIILVKRLFFPSSLKYEGACLSVGVEG